jgi:two-component system, OmpR family, heavy metal sensor histidine kinase CusS
MSSRMKSLSFKLVLLYVASVLLIMTVALSYIEYNHSQEARKTANSLMEVGPGYTDGMTPWGFEAEVAQKGENIGDIFSKYLNGVTAEKVIASDRAWAGKTGDYQGFRYIVNHYASAGASNSIAITGPITPPSELYYQTYTFNMSRSDIGPIMLTNNFFPATIGTYLGNKGLRDIYYMPVPGYDGLIIVASLDARFGPDPGWLHALAEDLLRATPIILLCALLLGWAISRNTVSPIKRIAETAERMTENDLSDRVEVKSQDEIGRLARSFNDMADRLEKTFKAQKQFVSDAAHELRTPLASMNTAISLALSKPREEEDYERLLAKLSSRLETMEKLTNDLLEQARTDENKPATDGNVIDVATLILEATEAFVPVFQDKNIGFEVETEKDVPIRGEKKSLMRVVCNLLDNAAKNTPGGGSVSVKAFRQDKSAVIKVSDTGRGIPPEHLDRIFERFYKVSDDKSPDNGFGLGLSICRGVVRRLGGEITVDSRQGVGSTFTVELPVYE